MVRTVLSQLRVDKTPGDGERDLGSDGVWGDEGPSLPRSITLRKEEPKGDMTHQGLLGPQMGGHLSSAHCDLGTAGCVQGEKEKGTVRDQVEV